MILNDNENNNDSLDIKKDPIVGLMVLSTVFWAGAFVAGKFSMGQFSPVTVSFFRFFIATLIIFPIMMKVEKDRWKLGKRDLLTVVIIGFIGMVGYHMFFYTALKYTTAINASVIGAMNPLVMNVVSVFFLKAKLGWKRLGAILLSLSGVILIITNGDIGSFARGGFNPGDFLMMMAVFCWVAYGIISKKVMENYSPLIITAYSFLTAAIILFPFAMMDFGTGYLPKTTFSGWMAIVYMAIFPSVVGYLVQQMSFKKLGTGKTMMFVNLVPVFSIILAVIFLGETISMLKIFFAMMIIAGVYLSIKLR